VFFLLPCLLIQGLFLEGCTAKRFIAGLETAEETISDGKPLEGDLKIDPSVVIPEYIARQQIVNIMNSLLVEEYSLKDIRRELINIRKEPFIPRYLKIEAGYILILAERIEELHNSRDSIVQKSGKVIQEFESVKKDNQSLKKELEEFIYKLKKLEEIYINTEKRRDMQ